ncbi:hypothetical protein B0A55_03167 [Friedmanniomyces simplex]|uniref:Transcription factor domain-containing protein n=1 Tax=Friedmanniomyces simplex TaxID=329884 RepID=A0A4V5NJ32_9PEZI|nr:hypothetical protein B0A55_03167 [Friedmanniomyces simplex]
MEIDTAPANGDAIDARSSARSCTTCSKAKAKRAAQLEKLESKIEHLVNALSTAQNGGQLSPPHSQNRDGDARVRSRTSEVLDSMCEDFHEDLPDGSQTISRRTSGADTVVTTASDQMMSPEEKVHHDALGVTMGEAEILLDRFRRLMAPSLPFVILPPGLGAAQLYEQNPFLLHAIVTVTYFHDLSKQQTLVKHLMRDVSQRILLDNEKNVGILQGLLVFVAWYHIHVFWGQQVTNLLHLAIAMTIDLGIDRVPGSCQSDFKTATAKAVQGSAFMQKAASLEEHRVLAGVFYLTSMLASSFKKIDALSYTRYLEDCLITLEQAREHHSDLLLVQIVRLQHLAEDTHTTETPTAPMQMYIKAFDADLTKLTESNPCQEDNKLLKMQYLTAEILVWELSLNDLQENKTAPLRSHLDDLYRCIDAIKRFIDVYFSIPIDDYLIVPFSVFGQFAHAFIVQTKLASLEVDGWDLKTLHESLNFLNVIDEAAARFEAVAKGSPDGLQVKNEVFHKWAHRIRWMKQVYEAKFSPSQNSNAKDTGNLYERQNAVTTLFRPPDGFDPQATPGGGPQQPTPPDDALSGDFFNYLENDFWSNFPAEYDLDFQGMVNNMVSPYP